MNYTFNIHAHTHTYLFTSYWGEGGGQSASYVEVDKSNQDVLTLNNMSNN